MKMMFDTVNLIGDKLIDIIKKKLEIGSGSLEMRELSAKYTADVIGNVAFGLDCKCNRLKSFNRQHRFINFLKINFKVWKIRILNFTNKVEGSLIYQLLNCSNFSLQSGFRICAGNLAFVKTQKNLRISSSKLFWKLLNTGRKIT